MARSFRIWRAAQADKSDAVMVADEQTSETDVLTYLDDPGDGTWWHGVQAIDTTEGTESPILWVDEAVTIGEPAPSNVYGTAVYGTSTYGSS